MRIHEITLTTVLFASGLALGGCDDASKPEPAAKANASAGKPSPAAASAGAAKNEAIAAAGDDAAAQPTGDPLADIDKRVQRAAALAKKIEAEPEKAGEILDAAGLERDAFEDLIYEISADPSLAKQYQAAMVAQTG